MKRRDAGNGSRFPMRDELLGGRLGVRGDRCCREVEGWPDGVIPAIRGFRRWRQQLVAVPGGFWQRSPRTRC